MPARDNIFSVSLAKEVLRVDSVEHKRALQYAATVGTLTMLVITRDQSVATEVIEIDGLTLIPVVASNKLSLFSKAYRVGKRYLQQHSQQQWQITAQDAFETGLLAYLLARRSKSLFHLQVHGDPFENPRWRKESLLNHLRLRLGRYLLPRACRIRVVSKRTKQAMVKLGIDEQKVTTLPIQQDLQDFLAVGAARTYEPKPNCTFMFVGRFSPEKDILTIVRAFAQAAVDTPNIQLHLVGRGSEEIRILHLIRKLHLVGKVTLTTWTDDVPAAMAAADVLVVASLHEGYGLVLVEAMAAGLPIITTDVGCVGEVVKTDVHAQIVPFQDPTAYAQAMQFYANAPEKRQQVGRVAHQAARHTQLSKAEYLTQWKDSFC